MTQSFAPVIRIEDQHNRAIRDEIGCRLGFLLRQQNCELPPALRVLLDRFSEIDLISSPSIVPSEDVAVVDIVT